MANPILSKKCAIFLPYKDGVSIGKYFAAVGKIIGFHNIVYGGRHANRVLMHLANEHLVETFTESHRHVTINDERFPVSKVSQGVRLVFLNVNPSIPNTALMKEITKFARPVSQISYVSTGLQDPRLSHILSYRRQVYVESKEGIPRKIYVRKECEVHTICLRVECSVECKFCNVDGHSSKQCRLKLPLTRTV